MRNLITMIILSLPLYYSVGCGRLINYENKTFDPQTGVLTSEKTVTYRAHGVKTEMGDLRIRTPEGGEITLKNYSSDLNAIMAQSINTLVNKIPNMYGGSSGGSTTVVVPAPENQEIPAQDQPNTDETYPE